MTPCHPSLLLGKNKQTSDTCPTDDECHLGDSLSKDHGGLKSMAISP